MKWGDETIFFLEIDQPFCVLTWGETTAAGTCPAVLGVDAQRKCFQSRFTCPVPASYNPATLTLRFGRPQLDMLQYGNVVPSVESYSITPMAINLGGMDENVSAFGRRETVNVTLSDHQWDDHLVDKYRLERSFVPGQRTQTFSPRMFRRPFGAPAIARREFFGYNEATLEPYVRGTFWGKWLARNPYHQGSYRARIRMGTLGQAIDDMRVRHYVVDRIEGPTDGQVRVVLKDLFSLVEARKAVMPRASLGELSADLTGSPGTFTLSPAGIGNTADAQGGYASITAVAGHVAIGDEVIEVTRSGDVCTVVTRGAFNTTPADHKQEDLVQIVVSEVAQLVHDIIYRALTNFGGIAAAQINKPLWDIRAAGLTELYTARITKPTPVNELVGELMLQSGCTVWPDPSTGMIEFRALQAGVVSPVVNDDAWIAEGRSLSTRRQDAKRVSQAWVYYGQIKPNENLDEKRNYHSRAVTPDLREVYESEQIRDVFSRWIPQFGRQSAQRCGERLIAMFQDPPLEATIPLHASRDRQLNLAQYFSLQTAEVQDDVGAQKLVTMAPVEVETGESDLEVKAQQVTFATLTISGTRTIYIENDSFNLTLRAIHDSLYAAPTGSEVIEFIVLEGVTDGSTSTANPAMDTGEWPAMATKPKIIITGKIQGKGGKGGNSWNTLHPGENGFPGGTALKVRAPFEVGGTGKLWSGAGGGGGGHASNVFGGGGGAGAGVDGGDGGLGGTSPTADGSPGTADAGGEGGIPTQPFHGGPGGGPGLNGSTGGSGELSGGASGYSIDGIAFVTLTGTLDIRGPQV